jgi:hypothetical protein
MYLKKSPGNGGMWDSESTRRSVFEAYAKEHNFDPLNPTNWFSRMKDLKAAKVWISQSTFPINFIFIFVRTFQQLLSITEGAF